MRLNSRAGISGGEANREIRLSRLALVRSDKVELSPASFQPGVAEFTAAEMRHNFAIWPAEKDPASAQKLVYYCIRCKQAFTVDTRKMFVNALDASGNLLRGMAAVRTLATFSQGPCPAFSAVASSQRPTGKIIPLRARRGRLATLILALRRRWKATFESVKPFFRPRASMRRAGAKSRIPHGVVETRGCE
jgi:hypothetical protein